LNGAEDMAEIIMAYGADVTLRDDQGRTVMEVALSNNRDGVVHILRAAEMRTFMRKN
jgi:ankyrin repeat protein